MNISVPVLSVRQPWASAIVAGVKPVENRSWPPPRWILGRKMLIHAAKKIDPDAAIHDLWPECPTDLPTGMVVGLARVVGVQDAGGRTGCPWSTGPFCWLLEDAVPVEPFSLRGALKIFEVHSADLPALVIEALDFVQGGTHACDNATRR